MHASHVSPQAGGPGDQQAVPVVQPVAAGQELITEQSSGPLFDDAQEPDDIKSETIYVLRSRSEHPFVAKHRELIHKIGVTGGKVETRIAGADKDATYLLAAVEIVATYNLHNLNRTRLENIFHCLFGAAQFDLTIENRFGHLVRRREWFLVPLNVIDEAVQRIRDGSITDMRYDLETASLLSTRAWTQTLTTGWKIFQTRTFACY